MKHVQIILLLFVVGCSSSNIYYEDSVDGLINDVVINNYFIDNSKYWGKCYQIEDKIEEDEDPYEIDTDWNYDYKIVDERMTVQILCEYDVSYLTNPLFSQYETEEIVKKGYKVDFKLNIDEKNGKYKLNSMEVIGYE